MKKKEVQGSLLMQPIGKTSLILIDKRNGQISGRPTDNSISKYGSHLTMTSCYSDFHLFKHFKHLLNFFLGGGGEWVCAAMHR